MPPSAEKRREVQARFARIQTLRSEGLSFEAIGQALDPPISKGAVLETIRRNKLAVPALQGIKCALPECDVVFTPKAFNQRFCTHLHAKRGCERARLGMTVLTRVCRLAGCEERIVTINPKSPTAQRFCTVRHNDIFSARQKIGYYDKLVAKNRCSVPGCSFWGPTMQVHHLTARAEGGSDDPKNLRPVCPNHHAQLHAGLATFDGRTFVDLREKVRKAEMRKRRIEREWKVAHA